MFLYRCDGDMLRVQKDGGCWTAALPGTTPGHGEIWAHISRDERYIAFGNHRDVREETLPGTSRLDRAHGIWVYDLDAGRLMAVPHRVQRTDVFWDIMFDAENVLYYSDGNTLLAVADRRGERGKAVPLSKGGGRADGPVCQSWRPLSLLLQIPGG